MNTPRNPDELIHAFFQDGLDELPDRSFDSVRAAIDQTRQWAIVGPWKEPQFMTATRFALIAAAIAVVAIVAIRFLPSSTTGPAPGTSPAPTLAPTPTVAPTPTSSPLPLPSSGAINPGNYYIADPADLGLERLSFALPAGWTKADFVAKNLDTQNEVMFSEWPVKYVFPDACKWDESNVVDTASTQQLLHALAAQKNRTASPITSTTVAGYPAQELTLTVSPTLDTSTCTNGNLRYWPGTFPSGPDFGSGMCCNLAGNVDTLYVMDINDKSIVLIARHYPNASPQDLAELQSIVDSVQITP